MQRAASARAPPGESSTQPTTPPGAAAAAAAPPARKARPTAAPSALRGAPGARAVTRLGGVRARRGNGHRGALVLGLLACSIVTILLTGWVHGPSTRSASQSRRAHCATGYVRNLSEAPRPLLVVAAGASRSGSTVLFNALRILLRIRDPNSVAGWYIDLSEIASRYGVAGGAPGDALRALRGVSTVLVKLHTVADWMTFSGGKPLADADAVFTSHRDVRQVVQSERRLGWGSAVSPAALKDPDFCAQKQRRAPRALQEQEYGQADIWVLAARAHLCCREQLLHHAGDAMKEDIPATELSGLNLPAATEIMRRLARHLDYPFSSNELTAAASELLRLRPPECIVGDDPYLELNPVTHLHRGHIRGSGPLDAQERLGASAISNDTMCRNWLVQLGYAL